MTIDERSRHSLYMRLEALLGADEATTLMEHLPPTGWADVATKRDLDHLDAVLRGEIARLEATLETSEHRIRADLTSALVTQTRTLVFSMVGTMFTLTTLVLAASRLA